MIAGRWGTQRTATAEWRRLRRSVLERDEHRCQLRLDGCDGAATDVDHIIPVSASGTDDESNLRSACRRCHLKVTSRQGVEARRRKAARRKRPPERHPGLLTDDALEQRRRARAQADES